MADDLPFGMEPLPPERMAEIERQLKRVGTFLALYPPPWALALSPEGDSFLFVDRNQNPIPVLLPTRFLVFGLALLAGINELPVKIPRRDEFPPKKIARGGLEGWPRSKEEWMELATEAFAMAGVLPGETAWFAWIKEHKFLDVGGADVEDDPKPSPYTPVPVPTLALDLGRLLSEFDWTAKKPDPQAKGEK